MRIASDDRAFFWARTMMRYDTCQEHDHKKTQLQNFKAEILHNICNGCFLNRYSMNFHDIPCAKAGDLTKKNVLQCNQAARETSSQPSVG